MHSREKKSFSLFLAVMITLLAVAGAVPVFAQDSSGVCGADGADNVKWAYDSALQTLTLYGEGETERFDSPDSTPWADFSDSVKLIKIENGITSIGNGAFESFSALESVRMADTVAYIGQRAFADCVSLEKIDIPYGTEEVNAKAFWGCESLETVLVPDGVRLIDTEAFGGCTALVSVMLPQTLRSVSTNAFSGCDALENVYFAGDVRLWSRMMISGGNESLKAVEAVCDFVYPDVYKETDGGVYLYKYNSADTEAEIPSRYEGRSVVRVGAMAFKGNTAVTKIQLPASVEAIEAGAFSGCSSLVELELSGELTDCGYGDGEKLSAAAVYTLTKGGETVLASANDTDSETVVTFTAEEKGNYRISADSEGILLLWILDAEGNVKNGGYGAGLGTAGEIFADVVCEAGEVCYAVVRRICKDGVSESTLGLGAGAETGDVNGDGDVSVRDVLLLRKYLADLASSHELSFAAADVDGNGELNVRDVLTIRKYLADMIDSFPVA